MGHYSTQTIVHSPEKQYILPLYSLIRWRCLTRGKILAVSSACDQKSLSGSYCLKYQECGEDRVVSKTLFHLQIGGARENKQIIEINIVLIAKVVYRE